MEPIACRWGSISRRGREGAKNSRAQRGGPRGAARRVARGSAGTVRRPHGALSFPCLADVAAHAPPQSAYGVRRRLYTQGAPWPRPLGLARRCGSRAGGPRLPHCRVEQDSAKGAALAAGGAPAAAPQRPRMARCPVSAGARVGRSVWLGEASIFQAPTLEDSNTLTPINVP